MASAAGTLYIVDAGAHAQRVRASAVGSGFQGPVVERQIQDPQLLAHDANLYAGNISADRFEKSFEEDVVNTQMAELRTGASQLNQLRQDGAHDSAINLSLGMSKASTVQGYYDSMRRAWDPEDDRGDTSITLKNEQGAKLLHNFAAAHGLDEARLRSQDPQVSGPERGKLQQILLSKVNGLLDGNHDMQQARADYDSAVENVEKNHNSVVVAAENAGSLSREFRQDAGSYAHTRVSGDFFNNPLVNANTTTVGALQGNRVASYSSKGQAQIYANGTLAQGNYIYDGSSYAAPRVAAALARMHQLNPNVSNAEVEKLVMDQLTRKVDSVSALDADKARAAYGAAR